MKVKTTRKAIVNSTPGRTLKSAGYCDLQALLRNHQPIAYTSGVYGWNFDVYEVCGLNKAEFLALPHETTPAEKSRRHLERLHQL